MQSRRYDAFLVCNCAYGFGPFIRITELAIRFNQEIERLRGKRLGIIVPLVLGPQQKEIMFKLFASNNADYPFASHNVSYPGEILLDQKLGEILSKIFYGKNSYEESLRNWVSGFEAASLAAQTHLSGNLQLETLDGQCLEVDGKKIVVELGHSPRIIYGVAPAYYSWYGYISDVLEYSLRTPAILINQELLRAGIRCAEKVEMVQKLHCIAYPGIFAGFNKPPRYPTEREVPPLLQPFKENNEKIDEGIYVTVTGIPGLESLYQELIKLGMKIYTNPPKKIPGSTELMPYLIPNPQIKLHIARTGWSSVIISLESGPPLVFPKHDFQDDPEIFFNNETIRKLGIGIEYRGQSLEELIAEGEKVKQRCAQLTSEIQKKLGSLDGNLVCAQIFAEHFLKNLQPTYF